MSTGPIVSLSTCWCSGRHDDGYAMAREIADLGFAYTELSHGIRLTLVPGILKALEEGVIKISTTHNFCPLPPGTLTPAPNLYQPTSPLKSERALWLRYTTVSLDFAQRVGARVLITHMGSEFFFFLSPARQVNALAQTIDSTALRDNPAYQVALKKLFGKLRKAAPKHYQRLREGLTALAPKAQQCGVKFGCENREGLLELPLDDDMDAFLTSVSELGVCGGWHDTGHARLKEMEGVISHSDFLDKNGPRLLGFHLHDVSADGHDHQPIGTGSVDWALVRKHIRPDHILVMEMSPRLTVDQIKESKANLEKILATRAIAATPLISEVPPATP